MKKISIVIPCYNVEQYIEQCLNSILNQSYQDFEIICVNDGSTDCTLEILENYRSKDKRIKVVDQENKGLSESRNIGFKWATGDFIMFVDGDDWLEMDCLEKTGNFTFDLVCFSYNRIFKNQIQPRIFNFSGEYKSSDIQRRMIGLTNDELKEPEQANTLVTAWAKIYRKEIIQKNDLYFHNTKEVGTEDLLFNIEYLENCTGKTLIIDHPYYNYLRHNSNSLTTLYKPFLFSQWTVMHQKIFEIVKPKKQLFHDAFYNRVALSIIGLGLNEMENKEGFLAQIKNLSIIVNNPLYKKSYQKLPFKYFSVHWRILFIMTKYRVVFPIYVLIKMMSLLLKRKNN